QQREALVVDHQQQTVALDCRARGSHVERDDLDPLLHDVLPDIQLGPVGQREYADGFALVLAGVVEVPQLWTLVLRVPSVGCGTEAEDAFLGAALFLVTARAAKRG